MHSINRREFVKRSIGIAATVGVLPQRRAFPANDKVIVGVMGLGGLLARAMFGADLYAEGATPNQALPLVFIELFPTWLAALVGVGVLAAIMSTADGLVVSSSQIVANDLYRRTIVPRLAKQPTEEELDRQVLNISRISTVVVLLLCMGMAWALIGTNINLIVWMGIGGMMAAFAGPLVLGALCVERALRLRAQPDEIQVTIWKP